MDCVGLQNASQQLPGGLLGRGVPGQQLGEILWVQENIPEQDTETDF